MTGVSTNAQLKVAKGTKDTMPHEMAVRERLFDKIREVCRRFPSIQLPCRFEATADD